MITLLRDNDMSSIVGGAATQGSQAVAKEASVAEKESWLIPQPANGVTQVAKKKCSFGVGLERFMGRFKLGKNTLNILGNSS